MFPILLKMTFTSGKVVSLSIYEAIIAFSIVNHLQDFVYFANLERDEQKGMHDNRQYSIMFN